MIGVSLSLLVAAQIFVACQPNSGGPAAPAGPPTSGTLGGQGTGDSAGGDGINNKVFEKYAVPDIRKTREWVAHIEPIEKHLNSLPKLRNVDANNLLSTLARLKRWFIAPISLEQIEKSTLGVEFIKDPIQQLALQSDKSIWIDETLYNMSTDPDPKRNNSDLDRATLQMHEMMVALYLIRFMPAEEVCRLLSEDPRGCGSVNITLILGEPEPRRKLEKLDYERIRSMTAWMMNNAIHITSQREVFLELYRNSFDPRFFTADPEAPHPSDSGGGNSSFREQPPLEVELGSQAQVLAGAKTLGRIPQNCAIDIPRFVNGICDVNVELTTVPGESRMLKVTVKVQSQGVVKEFVVNQLSGTEAFKQKLYLHPSILDRHEAVAIQSIGFAFPVDLEVVSAGQDFYEVYVGWATDMQTVQEIILEHRRVTGFVSSKAAEVRGYAVTQNWFSYGTPADHERKDILITSDKSSHGKNIFRYPGGSGHYMQSYMLNPKPITPKK